MSEKDNLVSELPVVRPHYPPVLRSLLLPYAGVIVISAFAAIFLPRSRTLAAFGDFSQLGLVAATAMLALRNSLLTRARVRAFWMLICAGMALWTASNCIWTICEVMLHRPVPDVPAIDILLFVKIVPLAAAVAIGPDREVDSRFRAFGVLDFSILIVYSLYLYAIAVYAYRLLPGAVGVYNFRFNVASAIGNQLFLIVAGMAVLRSEGYWKGIYRIFFFGAASYCLASILGNVAIDQGRYYTGGPYDIPLILGLTSFACVPVVGRSLESRGPRGDAPFAAEVSFRPAALVSSHVAMLVILSTPVIGFWLLSSPRISPEVRSFYVVVTLLTILLLTMLLSIKQDFLTAGLVGSLERVSENYTSINRYKSHLAQTEKLTTLGELVAGVANQIKVCMGAILEASVRLTSRPDAETRIQNMAGKIGQYAQRTDLLVDNMLHFAQETPLRLAPLELKPLVESALHLSRIEKLPNVRVEILEESACPPVRGDSSQLLHVFLQLISNAMDALEESGAGSFTVAIRPDGERVTLEFADSGPGIKEPRRVFEPFYTTKPVGKGTGLGLSTCYGIIQQHCGDISCRNRPEGGAIFSVVLPLAMAALPHSDLSGDLLEEGAR